MYFKYNPRIINDNRKDTLTYSFKLLINKLWPDDSSNDNYDCFSPYEFKDKISKMNPLFSGIGANDAKDLVNFIIMQLHDELNKANTNSININNKNIDQTNPKESI
jgi:ubiquitin C-terminal hydrolase